MSDVLRYAAGSLLGVVLAVVLLLAISEAIRAVRRWRWLRSERERFTCHRKGDLCTWAGCPRQHDDLACDGCFLITLKKDN